MGKINQGILGGFNGKVGSVIGSSWKGKAIMRGIAQSISNPKTPAQMAQRAFFAEVNGLARQFTDEQVKTFFPNAVQGMTKRNLLVKQLAEAQTVSNGTKAFDASKLSTLGNASGTFNFGTVTVLPVSSQGPGDVTTLVQLDVIIETWTTRCSTNTVHSSSSTSPRAPSTPSTRPAR